MSTKWPAIVAGIGTLLVALPVLAHHSFSAEFDANSPVEVTGSVTRIEWLNPHVWFFVDVASEAGEITNWGVEMGSPNQLVRAGWSRTTMSIGDVVAVEGSRARDESDNASARVITLASTGERLFAASSQVPGSGR